MKRFIKRPDLTSLWEEDGDLKRMKAFFHTISVQSDLEDREQIKQNIKEKALKKMAIEEEQVGLPVTDKNGLVQRIRIRLRILFGHRPWKLGISLVGLAFFVIIGQGIMNGSINLLPRIGSTEKPNQSLSISQPLPSSKSSDVTESQGGGAPNDTMTATDSTAPQTASSQGPASSSDKGVSPTLPVPPNAAIIPPADAATPRKITHNLSLTLEVATINDAVTRISKEVQKMGGYVVESQQNGSDRQSTAHLTLKVPADKLNGFRDSLVTWGEILDEHLLANDITNQYYDSQVRLQTLETEEKRYLEILNQAKTVDDVLKVENALTNIRQQIEQLKGQLKLWNNIVDYSTMNLQLVTQQTPNLNVKNPWQPVSWSNTWRATQDAVLKTISSAWNALNYLVVGIGYALPYLLVGALGWGSYRAWRKRKSH
ncbi:MAG TPA: DUF4349 domain-containing protein [Desulfosporosinus sp.]|jgi:hypothetical protein|nr:DUF4349 domain-containing protein [Desulfosporosinus sp.]